jgi:hypothetical protein
MFIHKEYFQIINIMETVGRLFIPIGTLADAVIYYTPIRQIKQMGTEADFTAFKQQLDAITGPWIWVVDCAGVKLEQLLNIRLAQRIATLLRAEHADRLKDTWIMQMNGWLRSVLSLFKAAVTVLSSDRLELFVQLQRIGCSHHTVELILAAAASGASSASSASSFAAGAGVPTPARSHP